jgi:hypothetical protein
MVEISSTSRIGSTLSSISLGFFMSIGSSTTSAERLPSLSGILDKTEEFRRQN